MNWEDCIRESKDELGVNGWCNNWDEVVELAKEKYWDRETFKELKEDTIDDAGGKCKLCFSTKRLTAHHIFYGESESTICLCKKCHDMVHHDLKRYGFLLQILLLEINGEKEIPQNLFGTCEKIKNEMQNIIDLRGVN